MVNLFPITIHYSLFSMTQSPIFPSHIRDLTSVFIGLTEQRLHIILSQRLEETSFGGDEIFDEGAFLFLQL